MSGEGQQALDLLLEGVGEPRAGRGGDEGVLEEEVQAVTAVSAAEHHAEDWNASTVNR